MPVSLKYRMLLQQLCKDLIEIGYSCFPKKANSKATAFKKGESYQKFLVTPVKEDPDFAKLVIKRFEEDPWVGGIALAGGVGGLLIIDYDASKTSNEAMLRARKTSSEFGAVVYSETRVEYIPSRDTVSFRGWHFVLRAPVEKLANKKIIVEHSYRSEFSVRHFGLVTISPSILVTKNSFSFYLRYSSVDIKQTLYDRKLDTLPKIVSHLGGKLVIKDVERIPAPGPVSKPGTPYHDLGLGIGAENVWEFLKLYADYTGCPGLRRLVESLEKREPIPIPYFIYQDYITDTNHPRSSWTIAENLVARILAEAGATDEAFEEIEKAFREAEEKYQVIHGPVDHESTRRNIREARRFREHGHDKAGACLFKIVGLCDEECTETGFTKLSSLSARQAMARAYARAKRIA